MSEFQRETVVQNTADQLGLLLLHDAIWYDI